MIRHRLQTTTRLSNGVAQPVLPPSTGIVCYPQSAIKNWLWACSYAEIDSINMGKSMRSSNCTHTRFNGIPKSAGGYFFHESCYWLPPHVNEGEARVVSEMFNVTAPVFAAVFPPRLESQYGLTEGRGRAVDGPVWEMIEEFENEYFDQLSLAASAYYIMRKQITDITEISILNFIIELKDIRKMFKLWDRSLSVIKNVANAKLNVSFGWRPFIADVCNILRALGNWRQKLKKLLAEVHQVRRSTYKFKPNKMPEVGNILYSRTFPNPGACLSFPDVTVAPTYELRLLLDQKPEFQCGMKHSLFCPEMSKIQAEVRGFCDAFGLRWDPAIIWNAIPFSFIVDWFWDVSTWLEVNWAKPTLPVELRVHDFYVQWKYSARLVIAIDAYCTKSQWPEPDLLIPNTILIPIRIDRFVRRRLTPSLDELSLAGWSKRVLDKTLLGAALAVTNTARPKKVPVINRARQRDLIRAAERRQNKLRTRKGFAKTTPYQKWKERQLNREQRHIRDNIRKWERAGWVTDDKGNPLHKRIHTA